MEIRRRPPNPKVKVANLEYAIPHSEAEPRNILEKIVWEKDLEVERARKKVSLESLKTKILTLPPARDFVEALRNSQTFPAVIAEIKKASPSKGVIRENFDPQSIAIGYLKGGASCLSVLTDKTFFQGGFEVLVAVREVANIPILCKDFILTPYQLYQARAAGADAVLFIASILTDQDLIYLRKVALSLGLFFLVEVHDEQELTRVLDIGGFPLIGVNNRDLGTFETDLGTTELLAKKFQKTLQEREIVLVSESGLFDKNDLNKVYKAGARAVLVGEALMREDDVSSALRSLLGF